MTEPRNERAEEQVRLATERALDLSLRERCPVSIVDSPPGAGKTQLVETVAAVGAYYGLKIGVIAPRAQQTYDLLSRLTHDFDSVSVQLLKAEERDLPPELAGNSRLHPPVMHVRDLSHEVSVVVGTAAKFLASARAFGKKYFDLLICDEAYQLAYKELAPLFGIATQVLLVGDPGQLSPLIIADITRFESAPYKVHRPAPEELLRRFPDIPVVRLPATRRLLQDTVSLIQPSLYPRLPFMSIVDPLLRCIEFRASGMNTPIDLALDMLCSGASIVGMLLPRSEMPVDEVDEELSEYCSRIAQRLFERRSEWAGVRSLNASDVGCVDSHVASGATTSRYLRMKGISTDELMVTTPEVWQGSQRPIMIVKNPLSGKPRLSAFDLDPGRLCVMLSRHELGCIVIGREGFLDSLEQHQHNCAERAMGANNREWAGWSAHNNLWSELERLGRLVRI